MESRIINAMIIKESKIAHGQEFLVSLEMTVCTREVDVNGWNSFLSQLWRLRLFRLRKKKKERRRKKKKEECSLEVKEIAI